MSFRKYVYTDDDGLLRPIRLSSEVASQQTPTPATTGFTSEISAIVSRSNRGIGIRPRYVSLERRVGSDPDIKVYYNSMPVCSPADFASLALGDTVTLDGVNWTISGKVAESRR